MKTIINPKRIPTTEQDCIQVPACTICWNFMCNNKLSVFHSWYNRHSHSFLLLASRKQTKLAQGCPCASRESINFKSVSLSKLSKTIKSDDEPNESNFLHVLITNVKSGWCKAGIWLLGCTACLCWPDALWFYLISVAATQVATTTLISIRCSSTQHDELQGQPFFWIHWK